MFPNVTQTLVLQTAINILLNKLSSEMTTHTTCIITDKTHDEHLHENTISTPNIKMQCDTDGNPINSSGFDSHLIFGVNNGCAYFLVSQACVEKFLRRFLYVHDQSISKYERKLLVILGDEEDNISEILKHSVVKKVIPLTLFIQVPYETSFINIYTSFPYSQVNHVHNRYFLNNFTFEKQQRLIPIITDLEGTPITGAFFDYPPFVSISRVDLNTGNADIHRSNESRSLSLEGLEGTILIEFCKKYNCTVTVRLDYDEELWGSVFPNHTGKGLLGAIAKYDADVTAAAFYIVGNRYNLIQYTVAVQLSGVTHVLPKPKPLPYFYTPILPFPLLTWICVVMAFFLGAIFLIFFNRATLYMKIFHLTQQKMSFTSAMLTVLKISVNQNVSVPTKTSSSLIMFGTLLAFALTIGSFYSGGLSSIMTVTPYDKPIDSIQRLVQSNLQWGTTSINWIYAVQQSREPVHVRYVNQFLVQSVTQLHKLVKEQKVAVIVETMQDGTLTYQSYVDKNDSKFLMIMKEPLYAQYTAMITTKTWPFMEQLNRIVFMQFESGIRSYWEYKSAEKSTDYEIQKNIEENTKNAGSFEPVRLTVSHILGAIIFLLFGHAFGIIVFLTEIFLGNEKKLLYLVRERICKRNSRKFQIH